MWCLARKAIEIIAVTVRALVHMKNGVCID